MGGAPLVPQAKQGALKLPCESSLNQTSTITHNCTPILVLKLNR